MVTDKMVTGFWNQGREFADEIEWREQNMCVYPAHREKRRFETLIFPVLDLVSVYHVLVQPAPGQHEEQ